MEKQEILEKSRRENQKGDERERTIRMEGESFSLLFVFLMGLILLTWKRVHGLPHEDVLTMFWTACVANRVYRLARRTSTNIPAGPAAEYLRHRDAADLSCVFDLESGKILSNGLRGGSAWTGMRF
mgnify:CR=1 FL=1